MNDYEQTLVNFIANLMNHGNKDTIEETATIIEECLPSGSGFDNGTRLNLDKSSDSKLVFETSFHHMNEHGYYKWTEHTVTVRPSFNGRDIQVSGRNLCLFNDIKDYIAECFDCCLEENVDAKLRERYLEIARGNMA